MESQAEATQLYPYAIARGICNAPQREIPDSLDGDAGSDTKDGERDEGGEVEEDD